MSKTDPDLLPLLNRIAGALERLAAPAPPANDLDISDAFVWHADRGWLEPVYQVNRVEIGLLRGIDRVRDILLDNTERFAAGLPANNVLLWGARGTGKSSLVKSAHAAVNEKHPRALAERPRTVAARFQRYPPQRFRGGRNRTAAQARIRA